MIDIRIFLSIAALLFSLGAYGIVARRNAIGVLISIELMANAVNLNLSHLMVVKEAKAKARETFGCSAYAYAQKKTAGKSEHLG